jgi:hypothetical protein
VAVVPHAETMTFDGHVAITLDVLEPTASITVNAVDMIFANTTLAGTGRKALVPKVSIDADAQPRPSPSTSARPGPLHPGHGLHRQDRHPGQRPVRDRLRHEERQEARAVHPIREFRCAQVRAVVG